MELVVVFLMLFLIVEGVVISSSMKHISAEKKNKILAIIFFVQLFLPAGLRNITVYNDSLAYAEHFQSITPNNIFDVNPLERFEFGYQILENIIYLLISKDPVALFFITSLLIQSSFIILFYRYSKNLWFTVFLFIGLTHYFFLVSGIRQGLAIAVFNFAIPYLFKQKWVWYYFIVFISAQFHSSAYILFLIPFLNFIRLSKKTLVYSIFITLVIFLLLDKILGVFYLFFPNYGSDYLGQESISDSKIGISLVLLTYLIGLIVVIKKFNFKKHINSEKQMLLLFLCNVLFLVISIKFGILVRYTHYFIPLSIILLTNSCYGIKDIMDRFMMYLFWVIFLCTQVYIIIVFRPEWFTVIPYKFYWE